MRGLDRFREHFRGHDTQFALIGGVAADMWLTRAGLPFRVTKDFDVVLLVEALDDEFLRRVWDFIRGGGYERKERADGKRVYFRFSKPSDTSFPAMLELFSRVPEGLTVPSDQTIVPIPADEDASSLSAILMDEDYYGVVVANREVIDDLPFVTPACLVLLKARAWGDFTDRRARGERIDEKDILKHRNDVFRLAVLLAPDGRVRVSARVRTDLDRILAAFPEGAPEWTAIEQATRLGAAWPGQAAVLDVLRRHFEVA